MQRRNFLLLAVVLTLSFVTHAATITVTTNADSGVGSLRAAVATAEGDGAADTIEFDAALNGQTITLLTVGDTTYGNTAFRISTPITIQATGGIKVTISGNNSIRPFFVASGGSLTLIDLTVMNGRHTGGKGGDARSDAGGGGGGPGMGGAVFVAGSLTVSRCLFEGNTAQGGSGGTFTSAVTNGGGGGGNMLGSGADCPNDGVGGAGAAGNAAVGTGGNGGNTGQAGSAASGSNNGFGAGGGGGGSGVFDGNAGGFGGGGGGGGVNANFVTGLGGFGGGNGTGVGGNGGRGAGFGGAIMNLGGTVVLSNSTFTGNTAAFGFSGGTTGALGAGGVAFSRNGTLTIRNCTLSGNTALQGGRSIYVLADGAATTSTLTIHNTIAGQATAGASEIVLNNINTSTGASATGANNIVRQAAAVTGVTFQNVNPLLGTLADNGGPTRTMNLLAGSPALNAGNNSELGGATLDQRGLARILDDPSVTTDIVDIGALESSFVTPTDLALTPASIAENQPVNSIVGTLSTIDADMGDTFTYTLVSGTGDTDNAKFNILAASLRTSQSFDFESVASYSVRVRSTDSSGLFFEKSLTITVTDVQENLAPTDIALSASTVAENSAAGTTVGTLGSVDGDVADTHIYALVSGAGSTDNASFTIAGNMLKTVSVFDFESKASYSIRVKSTDSGAGNLTFEKAFTISVANVNEAPVISSTAFSPLQPLTTDTVTFTVAALDPDGTTPTVRIDYGDGSSSSALAHGYANKGSYTVTITVTDGSLVDTETLTVVVAAADFNTDGFVGPMDKDSDADGVPDAMETMLGTNPNDASDSPVDGAKPISFRMEKPKAVFGNEFDKIEFKGVLHVPAGLDPVGEAIVIDGGGNVRKAVLDEKARFEGDDISFQLMAKLNTRKAKEARFKLVINGALLENMVMNAPKDEAGRPTQLTAHILFNGSLLVQTKMLQYRK